MKRVAVLFDGVIYPNTRIAEGELHERPMGGSIEFLTRLKDDKRIEPRLLTAYYLVDQVRTWLQEHGPYVADMDIENIPPANVYLMDTAMLFNGQFPVNSEFMNIRPWASPHAKRRAS